MGILLKDGTIYQMNDQDHTYFQDLYPKVDIDQELRNMEGWAYSNPSRRKTRRGAKKFINSWLCRVNKEKPLERNTGRSTRDTSLEEDLTNTEWAY